jgi:hypothetical protein
MSNHRAVRWAAAACLLALAALAAAPSWAAVQPQGPQVLTARYRFSGVTDDGAMGAGGSEATSVHCTNFGSYPAEVEVQIFNFDGSMFTGAGQLNPRVTYTFSTQSTMVYFDDVIIGGGTGTPAIYQGSGQVLADSEWVMCTAQVLDPSGGRPAFIDALPLHLPDGTPVDPQPWLGAFLPAVKR